MKALFASVMLLTLAACTTVETYHNACIEAHNTIAEQVGCVKANITEDNMLREDTLAQEYIRTGDYLVREAAEGRMTEEEAQLRFVQTLNRVRRDELREHAYQAAIDRYHRDQWPAQTECVQRDGRLFCTTY